VRQIAAAMVLGFQQVELVGQLLAAMKQLVARIGQSRPGAFIDGVGQSRFQRFERHRRRALHPLDAQQRLFEGRSRCDSTSVSPARSSMRLRFSALTRSERSMASSTALGCGPEQARGTGTGATVGWARARTKLSASDCHAACSGGLCPSGARASAEIRSTPASSWSMRGWSSSASLLRHDEEVFHGMGHRHHRRKIDDPRRAFQRMGRAHAFFQQIHPRRFPLQRE
jgi:hypothetical protein